MLWVILGENDQHFYINFAENFSHLQDLVTIAIYHDEVSKEHAARDIVFASAYLFA